jgi:hypothetical protein
LERDAGGIDRIVVFRHFPATGHLFKRAGINAFHESNFARQALER